MVAERSTTPDGLSQGTTIAISVSTVVGGIIVIALLICLIHRQRARRRMRKRRRLQHELDASARPRRTPTGFGTNDMSEIATFDLPRQAIPPGLAERFRRKDAYIQSTLGPSYPMHTDFGPDEHSERLLAVPPRALTRIEETGDMESQSQRWSQVSVPEDGKVSPLSRQRSRMSESAISSAHLKPPRLAINPPRWSWTNSQAPATPRVYVPTIASSRNSSTRFRLAVNWVKTQGERITSGEAPKSGARMILPRPGVLKNQASKPNLAPKKLVKRSSVRSSMLWDLEVGRRQNQEPV